MPLLYKPKFMLDGKEVEKITAFLFHAGGHEDPKPLAANAGKSFQGVTVHGMGFTFDGSTLDKGSNPYTMADELIIEDPRNQEIIKSLMG